MDIGPYLLEGDASNGTNSSSNNTESAHRKLLLQLIFDAGPTGLPDEFAHIDKFDESTSPWMSQFCKKVNKKKKYITWHMKNHK